jgi:hypothetical protein
VNLASQITYEVKPHALAPANSKYTPFDLILRFFVGNNEGDIDLEILYYGSDPDNYARIDSVRLFTNYINLQPVITGCLQAWEFLAGHAANQANGAAQPWNLTSQIDEHVRNAIQRGQALYRALFGPANNGEEHPALQRLKNHLRKPREQPLRIIVKSDKLYVPWNLLYIDGALSSRIPEFACGFLGFRHQVVQQIENLFTPPLNDFGVAQPLIVSQQRDITLPIHAHLDEFLQTLAGQVVIIERDHQAFTQAIQRGDCDDHILYFCCHGSRAPKKGEQPSLTISHGEKLYPDHIRDLMLEGHFVNQPFVVINACYAGEYGEALHDAFGPAFLSRGASTILAPAVTIPKTYAARYARAVFEELFHGPRTRPGDYDVTVADAIHAVTRRNIVSAGDLLALLYSTLIRRPVHLPQRFARTTP